jgi:hypothetical protein
MAIPGPPVALRPDLYVRSLPVACSAQAAGGCRESSGKSELIDSLDRDAEELGDVRHLPQLDLVSAEEHVSDLRESVPMLDQFGCRGRIPVAPIAGKNAGLEQPLDTTKPQLAGGPVGVGEGAGLDLDPPKQPFPRILHAGRLTAGSDLQALGISLSSAEVWTFRPRCERPPAGYQISMKREREMRRERDELDLLAAEAGQSALLVGMTALMLVVALVLGFAV